MTTNIIDERLKTYTATVIEDKEHALKEILQEIALYGLANANFFDKAIFHGGTALRILYGLPRFSEDLDFLLKKPDLNTQDQRTLTLWGVDFFMDKLDKLKTLLS